MKPSSQKFPDLFLAYRQAKTAISQERGTIGLVELADFESRIATRLQRLEKDLRAARWFDRIDIGRMVVMPKADAFPDADTKIVAVGVMQQLPTSRSLRLQLLPTPEFSITEVLYLWEFGPALESMLEPGCMGYRLKRVQKEGKMDRFSRDIYEDWREAFGRYRDDPIDRARVALHAGKHVLITSTDITSFFDSIDPSFLLGRKFVASLQKASTLAGRPFSRSRYRAATRSLLAKFSEFRAMRRRLGGQGIDIDVGVPIGAFTSRLFANVALAEVDLHASTARNVLLYRRYVDDIVVVSTRDPAVPPTTQADVLREILPDVSQPAGSDNILFRAPSIDASFDIRLDKTRIHDLHGQPGLDFLEAIKDSFAVVASERRAFFADPIRLDGSHDAIELFGDTAALQRVPRLRDADQFTLRRFRAGQFIRGLQSCAIHLEPGEAQKFIAAEVQRLRSTIDGTHGLDEFELLLSMLRVALLSKSRDLAAVLEADIQSRIVAAGDDTIPLSWKGIRLLAAPSRRALQAYLRTRLREERARSSPLPVGRFAAKTQAARLRFADLRYLDREDDLTVFRLARPRPTAEQRSELRRARKRLEKDRAISDRIANVQAFLNRSLGLRELIWEEVDPLSLLLSAKPPYYVDVARRFLARLQSERPDRTAGRMIDRCVDALRGTRYLRGWPTITPKVRNNVVTLKTRGAASPRTVRVILGNLPVSLECFKSAAKGKPQLTLKRYRDLDSVLREAVKVARSTKGKGAAKPLLLLPELAVPRRWARALAIYASRTEMSVVAGLEYQAIKGGLANQAMGVFPTGRWTAGMVLWTKRHPAHDEAAHLRHLKPPRRLAPPRPNWMTLIVQSIHGRIGVLICSELLEADALARLRGKIELLLVPAWNSDTGSFDHLGHAASSLLVHSFVCIANNAEGSDTRIVAPLKEPRHMRDWARLVMRNENQIIWGDLPIKALRMFHRTGRVSKQGRKSVVFRPLPPGWSR